MGLPGVRPGPLGAGVATAEGRTATPGVFFGAHSPRTLILAEKK